jgi:type IV pilus assembly protein PilY1
MNPMPGPTSSLIRRLAPRWTFVFACLLSGAASAQALVDIATAPLYGGRQPHPNVVVTTSVEFPTVGAAYLFDQTGAAIQYVKATTYLGYFDSTKCYTYSGSGATGVFGVSGPATNHECSDAFSGNFMNWASMSAIDEFRYVMTGGNRASESGANNGTVLMRAYLPDGTLNGVPDFFGLVQNFPTRTIDNSGSICTQILNSSNSLVYTCVSSSSVASAVLPNAIASATKVFIQNCKTFIYFGDHDEGSCGSPGRGSNLGASPYNVRINVCDSTEGPARLDLCLQYGGATGLYKPVGQAQVNAAKMRFAAFGYLMDHNTTDGYTVPSGCDDGSSWNRCRYGGVLRSPMKYVGPAAFDSNQVQSTNARSEINTDGTLVTNPEGSAVVTGGKSGFINYINSFGSTGQYKRYDPAGEMFYEAIRYFQNLPPTTQAVSGSLTNQVKDNFPILTSWTDPIGSICSQNYIINLSDANTWDDTYLPGFTGTPTHGFGRPASRVAEGGLDAYLWAGRIATLESTMNSITTNDVRPNLGASSTNIATTSINSGRLDSWAVAGAAYWANVSDIRSDLTGKQTIKTISVDVAEGSIDIHDRQLYLMGKYGGFLNTIDRTSDTFANPFWAADPTNAQAPAIRTNSEWEDSPGSASPANYILASNPQKLINGLRAAFAKINSQSGTLSGAALTSANLTFGSAGAFVATFDPARWSGSVLFDSLSVDSNGNLVVANIPTWDAGKALTTRCGTPAAVIPDCQSGNASVNNRNIVTTVTSLGNRTAVPFVNTSLGVLLDANYILALNTNPATGVVDTKGGARIDYLRGYRGDEASGGLGFRLRDSVMGDIVNSGPVFVGAPTTAIGDADYQAFFTANAARTQAVYVGANDGMLHAFNSLNGAELFAYIPGYSFKDLADLTDPGYQHEVFVDTVPKIQEVKVGSTWKTVLVGANGNGVQGIFGLDVTNPSAFGPTKVLFEFSDADDADFGSVMSPPEIAKLWVSGSATAPVYRYFAVVTGYNKKRTTVNGRTDTNVSLDTNNQGVLFLIALDHSLGSAWTLNTDYYKFMFPATNAAVPNGLGPVSLLPSKSGDGTTAAMYFGDLQGNLWKFNTSTGSPSTWVPVLGTPSVPVPIFVAMDANNKLQPITARVELANGPFGGTFVSFGTGEFLGATDLTLPATAQSEYTLLDLNPSTAILRSQLVQRTGTVSGTNVTITGSAFSYSGASSKKGWFLDFPSSVALGERSVTKPAIRTGLLAFTTLTLSNDLCTSGNGFIYQVDLQTGLSFGNPANPAGFASTVGIPGPPRVVDLTISAGSTQATGEVINKKTQTTLVSGTSGNVAGVPAVPCTGLNCTPTNPQILMPPTGQINWREITNWNDQTP